MEKGKSWHVTLTSLVLVTVLTFGFHVKLYQKHHIKVFLFGWLVSARNGLDSTLATYTGECSVLIVSIADLPLESNQNSDSPSSCVLDLTHSTVFPETMQSLTERIARVEQETGSEVNYCGGKLQECQRKSCLLLR